MKVDPTGVGDGFRAGFPARYQQRTVVRTAAQLGSYGCRVGPRSGLDADWSWDRDSALIRIKVPTVRDAAGEIGAVPVLPISSVSTGRPSTYDGRPRASGGTATGEPDSRDR